MQAVCHKSEWQPRFNASPYLVMYCDLIGLLWLVDIWFPNYKTD
jgi:hypothetical protein